MAGWHHRFYMHELGQTMGYMVRDREAWHAAVHGVTKSPARLSNFTFAFHFHALEKEMATHSSVLAWRISGTVGSCLWSRTESDTTEVT